MTNSNHNVLHDADLNRPSRNQISDSAHPA